jgi:hypothetical protein
MNRFLPFLLALLLASSAYAQNQPVSTRSYKGPPFTAFTAVTPGNTETCAASILDVSAYGSLLVRITDSGGSTVSTIVGVGGRYARFCVIDSDTSVATGYVVFRTYASETGVSPWFLLYEQNAEWHPDMQVDPITAVVTPLPQPQIIGAVGGVSGTSLVADFVAPVLMGGASITGAGTVKPVAIGSDQSAGAGLFTRSPATRSGTLCGVSPQASVSNLVATKTATIAGATTSTAITVDATVQNVGTVVLYCKTAVTNDDTPPTISTSDLHFILAAGTAVNDGTGGSATVTGLSNGYSVYCLAASGTGAAAFFCR